MPISNPLLGAAGNEGVNLSPVYILAVIGGAGGIIVFLFKLYLASRDREHALLMAQKDAALVELDGARKSYQEMASEAIKSAMDTANYYRAKEGKAPIAQPAPVVSESHSPSTEKQRETAFVQTLRATIVAIKEATGQTTRIEPEHAIEIKPVPSSTPVASTNVTVLDAVGLKQEIATVPEKTAKIVVEKIEENEKEQGKS